MGSSSGAFYWAEWTDGSHGIVAVDGQDGFEGVAGIIYIHRLTATQAVNSQKHPAPEENHLQSYSNDPSNECDN